MCWLNGGPDKRVDEATEIIMESQDAGLLATRRKNNVCNRFHTIRGVEKLRVGIV